MPEGSSQRLPRQAMILSKILFGQINQFICQRCSTLK